MASSFCDQASRALISVGRLRDLDVGTVTADGAERGGDAFARGEQTQVA